jgi:hypothetical protein
MKTTQTPDTNLYPVTWHNAQVGRKVWVQYRNTWHPALIEVIGRSTVCARIDGHKRATRVSYGETYFRNPDRNGVDKPSFNV